jgi:hypothetical protein
LAKPTITPPAEPPATPVLVTTAHRGVFFGYSRDEAGEKVTLANCRNVLYWGQAVKGFLGLAVTGPDKTCRVGPAAPSVSLFGVTSVTRVSDEAVAAFEKAPWSF